MSDPKRIFVGTIEIARQLYDIAEGFRALGHDVDTGVFGRNPQHPDLKYDHSVDLGSFYGVLSELGQNPVMSWLRPSPVAEQLKALLTSYDVYVFQWGGTLLPNNLDLPILKQLGKKVVSIFNGTEIRHPSAAIPVYESFGLRPAEFFRGEPVSLHEALDRVRASERFADVILSQPIYGALAVRPYSHFYMAMDVSLYEHRICGRDKPVVVHAPSRRKAKGTDEILAALKQLADEGVEHELRLLEGVPNSEVMAALVDADVVIDQLDAPTYGAFAAEGMLSGCAVASGNVPDCVHLPEGDRPVFHVGAEGLVDQLRELLTNEALRVELAERGRPFVEKHHGHVAVAQCIMDRLEDGNVDYYPSYFAKKYELPQGAALPLALKKRTAEIIAQHGLPEGASLESMVGRGLSETISGELTRWGANDRAGEQEDEPPSVDGLVDDARRALAAKDFASTAEILGRCMAQLQGQGLEAISPRSALALGDIAAELGDTSMAKSLYELAVSRDPSLADEVKARS